MRVGTISYILQTFPFSFQQYIHVHKWYNFPKSAARYEESYPKNQPRNMGNISWRSSQSMILWLVRPRAVVAMQHSFCYYITVVEQFHGYAHHSVLLRCMVTNSSKVRFSIGPSQCYIKKATESRVSLSLHRLVFGVSQSLGSEWVSQSTPVREWVFISESLESEEYSAHSEL
jgi:hypothetical protein